MAERKAGWSLDITTGIEVNQQKFKEASRIFDNFYNKYNDRQMQIDTSDMIHTVKNSISVIRELYKDGTKDSTGWINIRPELKSQFEAILSDAETMFSGIKTLFNDGSYIKGLADTIEAFDKQLSIVFSDIGGQYDKLNERQKELANTFGRIELDNDFSQTDIRARIELLKELIQVQSHMEQMNPSLKSRDFEIGYTSRQLGNVNAEYEKALIEMEGHNLQTVKQLARRRDIINSVYDYQYEYGDYEIDKENENYTIAIDQLTRYIQKRKDLIKTLQDNEHELFSVYGIDEYVSIIKGQISEYEGYLDEFKKLNGDNTNGPTVTGDLGEVVQQLEKIKEALIEIRQAFEPLTNAFADGGSALNKMLSTSVEDLDKFSAKLNEVYQMINTISNKDFNVTNTFTTGSSAKDDLEQIRQFRKEARELYKQVESLYNESFTTGDMIKKMPGGFEEILNFQALASDLDFTDLGKRIKSRSAASLGIVIDELNEWKKVLLQFNNLRNNVEAGSFNVSKYTDTSAKVQIGSKTTDADVATANDTDINNDISNKIKTLSEEIASDLTSIRTKMEETFDFSTLPFNDEIVKSKIDTIYQQFADLQSKISALDLNIKTSGVVLKTDDVDKNISAVSDDTSQSIDEATSSIKKEGDEAAIAAQNKREFVEANKLVADSGSETKAGVQEATDAIEEEGKAATRAAEKIQNAFKEINSATGSKPITINGTSYEDFENFALQLASSNNMKIDDVSVVMDGNDQAKLATVKMINEELAQSVVYTYRLKNTEDGLTMAVLDRYKASSNVNKALKQQLAAQKKADAERLRTARELAKNNQWLIQQQSKLDTQERRYKHSKKSIDGSTSLMSTETSLAADAEQTIDSLAQHIRKTIQNTIGVALTDEIREQILNDLRILNNEIAIAQNDKYSATNMKASSVETSKSAYKEYLRAFTANAQKANVFEQMKQSLIDLESELERVSDSASLDAFIDHLKIARNKFAAEKAKYAQEMQEDKSAEQNYNKALQLQDKLYRAKKQLAKVDAGSAKGQELTRQIGELQEQYDIVVKLLNNAEDYAAVQQRQVQLEQELTATKMQSQNSYGKTIFNRESRHYDTIGAKLRDISTDNLSDDFLTKISKYEAAYQKLRSLREEIANNPLASNSLLMQNAFQDATLEVERLRKEILTTFKESDKLATIPESLILGTQQLDASHLDSLRSSMIAYAAEVTDGKFKMEGFNSTGTELYGVIERGAGAVEKVTIALREGTNMLYAYKDGTKQVSNSWTQLGSSLQNGIKRMAHMYLGFYDIIRVVRRGLTDIKEIDLALTELKKVTNETNDTYKKFLGTASEVSSVIGSTVSDFTDATAAFARLGYSISESTKMAETAIVYKNVADGLDTIEESTDSIISTMMAYGIEANNTMGIIDRFNAVGNNFAITSAGIGEAMQRSASALFAGGNTIDESIGLITAANSVIQDPMQVGTALKTLTLRLRGAKVELEEAGLDAENMVETTSQLQAKLQALTHGKVNILIDDDTFKNTTQILREMSYAWEDMTDMERAAALELMGGKRQANILSSLISNFETVEKVIETSTNSQGSALAENEKWLDSIEGKTYQFTNALETMWSNMIDSDTAKSFIEFGTKAIQFLDTLPGKITAIVAALAGIVKFKDISMLGLGKDAWSSFQNFGTVQSQLNSLKTSGILPTDNIQAYATAVSSLTAKQQANMLMSAGLTKEQIKLAMATNGLKDDVVQEATAHIISKRSKEQSAQASKELVEYRLRQSAITLQAGKSTNDLAVAEFLEANASKLASSADAEQIINASQLTAEQKKLAIQLYQTANANTNLKTSFQGLKNANPTAIISMIAMIIPMVISGIRELTDSTEELQESYDNLQSSIASGEEEINAINEQLEKIQGQIDELSNKNLTFVEAEELRNLKAQSEELERQKKTQEDILAIRERQNSEKSINMINNLLSTTAANQERAAEEGAKWGKAIGVVAGALLAIGGAAAAAFTGGTSLTLTAAGIAGISGAMAGSSIGEWAGEAIGNSSKQVSTDMIAWYESYEKAIKEAQQKANEAEQKYLSDLTDKNYEAWQEKVEATNTLQEELYNGLEQMQEYVDNLEYNDKTAATIDGYNQLVATVNAKNLDGDITSQISSIESLRSEFAHLSKGVDEHGNNIALTADEYQRYNSIVEQVLAYQTGLTKSYNENGKAILRTADGQYTYNQLLEQSIALLKQQRQEAAAALIDDEKLIEFHTLSVDTFKSSVSADALSEKKPDNFTINGLNNPHGYFSHTPGEWDQYDLTKQILKAIEVPYNTVVSDIFNDPSKTIEENLPKIKENREAITTQITNAISKMDELSEAEKTAYVNSVNAWIDDIIAKTDEANNVLKEQLKERMYAVPQANQFYYDMDGTSIAFINDYIDAYVDGIESVEDLSNDQIKAIRDNIASLTTTLGQSPVMQELVSDIFTIDQNSMPVDMYINKVKEKINTLATDENFKNALLEAGFKTDSGGLDTDALLNMMVPSNEQIQTMKEVVGEKLKTGLADMAGNLKLEDLQIAYKYSLELKDGSMSLYDLQKLIEEHSEGIKAPIVQTYSSIITQMEQLDEAIVATSEIMLDNTKVTQEYKDSLVELGISEEELATCFDATNNLVVTNADKLKDLVRVAKQNTANNAKLAKSQAILQYYKISQEMKEYISAEGQITDGTLNQIKALSQEANMLEKTIAKYAMLEARLLGTTNAYELFTKAQEADSETDYIGNTVDMVLALGEAFNKATLGSESAQAAIIGLVPQSVYEDLDTVDEKMDKIYEYFKNGKLSEYFSIEYDDDGSISNAEMKLGNLKNFIEDGFDTDVFEGADWQHFELSDTFLETIKDSKDPLQDFADEMNVTKDVAFAFLKTLKDHDIEWLNGDYGTLLDQLVPETLESKIYNATQGIIELNEQLASGEIDAATYKTKFVELNSQLATAKQESLKNIFGEDGTADTDFTDNDGYLEAHQNVIDKTNELQEAATAYENAVNAVKMAEESGVEATSDQTTAVENSKKAYENAQKALEDAIDAREKFAEVPTEAEIKIALESIDEQIEAEAGKFDQAIADNFNVDENGYYTIKAGVDINALETSKPGIQDYVNLLNSRTQLNAFINSDDVDTTLDEIKTTLDTLVDTMESMKISLDPASVQEFSRQLGELCKPQNIKANIIAFGEGLFGGDSEANGTANIHGTAHAKGTAHKSGDWGLPSSEHNSLVGELGQELVVNPHTGRYYTVGDHGAEMVDLPKDAIIFNHKQTAGLLKNGHISSRGKAYAEGNAHVTIRTPGVSQDQWDTTGTADALSDAADSMSDAADEFREVFDWIEVRLEEINEQIDFKNAQLENATVSSTKNQTIDEIIAYHQSLYNNLTAGANRYYAYAKTLLGKIPAAYREAAQNGTIAIEEFVGEVDEKTLESIKEYREWVQKGTDVTKQAEETLTTIRDLAIQKIDNAQESGEVRADIQRAQTEKLQNAVDLDEERGLITSPDYYKEMQQNSRQEIEMLTKSRNEMQAELDEAVRKGDIKKGSDEWYKQIQKLYDIDAAIDKAEIDVEKFQNSINDLYWDNFDELITRLDSAQDETQYLIDLMSNSDMVVTPETEDGWNADQVEWTEEGIASMGLYAQQMEIAEFKAKQYEQAINDLTEDYNKGVYSENEYLEKLSELKDGQYKNIEAYHDAQDAIVDLHKTRVESIKEGIDKEIAAYEKLIQQKKEALNSEKDLYDFQKSVAAGQKNIADIQRKLTALSADNSASAAAKRKQLEAELLEAQASQEELYYNRSIDNQQTALDQELEDFQNEKDAEKEEWDKYLEDIKLVVEESLGLVQENASGVYSTLSDKASEYGLTLSDTVMAPWQDGALAISDYQTVFDTAVSSTTNQLEALKGKWQEVINKMAEASKTNINNINQENANYASASYTPPTSKPTTNKPPSTPQTQQKSISVGGKINAKGAKIYEYAGDKSGENQYYASDPIYVVLAEQSGYLKVRHHKSSSGVSGWFKKSDVKAYAKGSKGISEDQWAWIDELGEELQLIPGANGRLEYIKKGTGIVPADLTERLMDLAMDPQEVLDRNRPQITPSKSVVNNNLELHVDASVGELIHVEHLHGNNLDEINKVVNKAWDKKMEGLNSALRKFTR